MWRKGWRMSSAVCVCELCSFSHLSVTSPTTAHSPILPSLYLRHSSFSNPSVASPTSQFSLQPSFRFSYLTSSSLNSPGEKSSFSKLSVTSPTSQVILQPFRRFTYVTAHYPNDSVALPTSQLILQTFLCFTYVTAHSPTLLPLLLRYRLFTWRAAQGQFCIRKQNKNILIQVNPKLKISLTLSNNDVIMLLILSWFSFILEHQYGMWVAYCAIIAQKYK